MLELRQGLMVLLQELQSEAKPRHTPTFRARAETIAALKIEITNLEFRIIVAGGKLF